MAKYCSHAMRICNQPWLTFSNIYEFQRETIVFSCLKRSHPDNTHPEDASLLECNPTSTGTVTMHTCIFWCGCSCRNASSWRRHYDTSKHL
jgi:hypothetical protein